MGIKVLIVGGVAGGANVAARLRRIDENAEIIMFERGEEVSYANCGIPYYIGGIIAARDDLLVRTPESLRRRFNIDIRILNEVINLFSKEKEVEVKNLKTGEVYRESYDYLVLSPGAKPIVPSIPGMDKPNVFTVRTIPDSEIVKRFIENERPKNALVVGGGFIGLEMAENLLKTGIKVTIVEAADQVMAPLDYEMASLVHFHLIKNEVGLKLNNRVIAFEGKEMVEKAVLANGDILNTDMVMISIGVTPENDLAKKADLTVGLTGGIVVDTHMRTSDQFIFAVGDAIQVKHFITGQEVLAPLAAPAGRQARVAADNIVGRFSEFNGVQGTAIAKVLGVVAAVTGVNEKTLKNLETECLSCHLHPHSNATYYPGAEGMALKLIFTPGEGKILGAQIVGGKGVDKRIDVIATAIRAGMTVYDLQELELAYAPPFSSAKDPVNMAGYVAGNILNSDNPIFYWHEVKSINPEETILLDVRTEKEVKEGMLPGAINIPLDQLRRRIGELPKEKKIYVYCRVGLRGYTAVRILKQRGFTRVRNLSGGFLTYAPFI